MRKLTWVETKTQNFYQSKNATVAEVACRLQVEKINFVPDQVLYDIVEKYFPAVDPYDYSFTVKGVSKCDPADNYNVTIGKHIAESRAQAKAYCIAARILDRVADFIVDSLNVTNYVLSNCVDSMEACDKHADKLGGIER